MDMVAFVVSASNSEEKLSRQEAKHWLKKMGFVLKLQKFGSVKQQHETKSFKTLKTKKKIKGTMKDGTNNLTRANFEFLRPTCYRTDCVFLRTIEMNCRSITVKVCIPRFSSKPKKQ